MHKYILIFKFLKYEVFTSLIYQGQGQGYGHNQHIILKDIFKGDVDIAYKEGRHEVKHSIPTYDKSFDILGFEHKTDLHDGLKDMWEWAKQQPKRDRFIWPSYELDKGIYSFWKHEQLIYIRIRFRYNY